jgi:predicted DNA-binding transcriptional regulator AlpA
MTQPPIRLRAGEAAKYIRVSHSTLAKWRMRDEGPPWYRCGPRLVFYYKHEIDRWLARDHFAAPTVNT